MSWDREATMLHGRAARIGSAVWLLIFCAATAVTFIGLWRGVADPDILGTPQVERALESIGVSARAGIIIALVFPAVITTGAALLIFVRRTHDWMALGFSAVLVCLQCFTSVGNVSLLEQGGIGRVTAIVVLSLAMPGVVTLLYLFPDGRFRPPWTRIAAISYLVVVFLIPDLAEQMLTLIRPGADLGLSGQIGVTATGVAVVFGIYAQFRRYRTASTPAERLQAKWVTFPLGLAFAYVLVAVVLPGAFLSVSDRWLGLAMLAAIPLGILLPICITIAVLKYRLYDIDVVISKTVVFGGLAAFITAIYVGIVVGLGSLLGAGDEPNLALSIVATAVVAVAFQPARQRLTRFANRLVFGHRATPYEVLSSFAGDLAQAAAPERTLEHMAKLVADGTGADRVFVWLRVGETMRLTALWPEVFLLEPVPDRDLGELGVFEDFDHVEEVGHDGELLGAITLSEPRGEALNHTELELLRDLAGQAALVMRNLRLMEELRGRIEELHSSRRRLVRAQDDERRRLERDLHDGAQQRLAELTRAVREANTSAEREGASQAASLLAQVAEDGVEAIRTVRDLAHGIYPPILAADGLPGALAVHTTRAAVPVTIEADGLDRYEPDVEAAVYFCVLEAVNNAAKYANPNNITVTLTDTDGHLTFEVTDDGTGFDPDTTPRGHGLTNMTDRLDALGGHLELEAGLGAGCVIRGVFSAGAHVGGLP